MSQKMKNISLYNRKARTSNSKKQEKGMDQEKRTKREAQIVENEKHILVQQTSDSTLAINQVEKRSRYMMKFARETTTATQSFMRPVKGKLVLNMLRF